MKLKHDVFLLHRRHKKVREVFSIVILLLFFFGIFFAIYSNFREIYIIRPAILSEGVSTTGTYINKDRRETSENVDLYLSYSFSVDERIFQREYSTNSDVYNNTKVGDTVQIRYLPNAPHTSRTVDEWSQLPTETVEYKQFVCGSVLYILILLRMVKFLWKEIPLRLRGLMVNGELGDISAVWKDGSKYTININYSFIEPETGEHISGEAQAVRKDLSQQLLPPVGTRLAIKYLNKNNYRVL